MVAKAVELSKTLGTKMLVNSEIDDSASNGRGQVGIGIVAQIPGSTRLAIFNGDQTHPLLDAILSAARASGKDGWRQITIVVEKGSAAVARGASPGQISGFNARLRAEVDKVFPGHTEE